MRCGEPIRDVPPNCIFFDGDIVLLGSSTMRARFLKLIDGGTSWVHCGIMVSPNVIVHADPRLGVVRQTINEYLAQNDVDCICQLRPNMGNGNAAALFALDSANRRVAFDNSFSYKNGNKMYCTELVLLSWEAAGVMILKDANPGDKIKPSCLMHVPELCHVMRIPEAHKTHAN